MHSPTRPGPPLRDLIDLGTLGTLGFTQAYDKDDWCVPAVRDRFRAAAKGAVLDQDLLDNAELCLTELTTNAVRHAVDPRPGPQILVGASVRRTWSGFHLEIGVYDADWQHLPRLPAPGTASAALEAMSAEVDGGRGLLLVASLSEDYGYDYRPKRGKRIWCRWSL